MLKFPENIDKKRIYLHHDGDTVVRYYPVDVYEGASLVGMSSLVYAITRESENLYCDIPPRELLVLDIDKFGLPLVDNGVMAKGNNMDGDICLGFSLAQPAPFDMKTLFVDIENASVKTRRTIRIKVRSIPIYSCPVLFRPMRYLDAKPEQTMPGDPYWEKEVKCAKRLFHPQ